MSFPDAEFFGVKLVNGRPTRTLLQVANNEDVEVTFLSAMAGLLAPLDNPGDDDPLESIRNLTAAKYGKVIPAHTTETLTYSYATIMNPRDVILELKAVISRGADLHTLQVFQEKVSIVEAPTSIFDPQMCVISFPY